MTLDVPELVGVATGSESVFPFVLVVTVLAISRRSCRRAQIIRHAVNRPVVDAAALLHVHVHLFILFLSRFLRPFALAFAVVYLVVGEQRFVRHNGRGCHDVHR